MCLALQPMCWMVTAVICLCKLCSVMCSQISGQEHTWLDRYEGIKAPLQIACDSWNSQQARLQACSR